MKIEALNSVYMNPCNNKGSKGIKVNKQDSISKRINVFIRAHIKQAIGHLIILEDTSGD